jgi:tRNA U55 pseudouridine synthase TruB
VGLRRTRAAGYGLDAAIPLADAERDPAAAANAVVPMGRMLPHLPTVTLPSDEVRRVMCGRDIPGPQSAVVRLLDEGGDLVGVAEPAPTPGLLHPSVILR